MLMENHGMHPAPGAGGGGGAGAACAVAGGNRWTSPLHSDIAQVVFRIFDIFWCAAFLAELALRIIADGPHFLNSKNPERLDSKLKPLRNSNDLLMFFF